MWKYVTLMLCVVLAACGGVDGVTQEHIAYATKICEPNGGIKRIVSANSFGQMESCGYRCYRSTGKSEYNINAICDNNVTIIGNWAK